MSCETPLDFGLLADYWAGTLSAEEEAPVEEHLFGCDECSAALGEIRALAEGVRELARQGSLRWIASDAFLKRSAENGLRVRQYAPPAGGSVECTVTETDDLLIGRLAAALGNVAHVDLSICDGTGIERGRLIDIPFHARTPEVIYHESMLVARSSPTSVMVAKLVAVDEKGERLLGEYTFHHTRSLP